MGFRYYKPGAHGVLIDYGETGQFPEHLAWWKHPVLAETSPTDLMIVGGQLRLATEEEAHLNANPHLAVLLTAQDAENSATYRAKTQEELDAEAAANAATAAAQAAAILELESDLDNAIRIEKAIALTLIDELNILRGWLVAFKGEVAAAASLADLKTRVAGLADLPDRTPAQAKTAIYNKAKTL